MKRVSIYLFLISILACIFFVAAYCIYYQMFSDVEEKYNTIKKEETTSTNPSITTEQLTHHTNNTTKTESESNYYPASSSSIDATRSSAFFLQFDGKEIIVFESDKKTIYEKTVIDASHLTEDNLKLLKEGVWAENLEEVYAMLESYSS